MSEGNCWYCGLKPGTPCLMMTIKCKRDDRHGVYEMPKPFEPSDFAALSTPSPKYAPESGNGEKPTNPKDACGIKKAPLSVVPMPVIYEAGLGMLEGALKYGRHNYRVVGVRASVYFDATLRHLAAWWEGEDLDPESTAGLHHVSKAICSLIVLRDAMIQGKLTDDRPPRSAEGWMDGYNETAGELVEARPNPVPAYIHEPEE